MEQSLCSKLHARVIAVERGLARITMGTTRQRGSTVKIDKSFVIDLDTNAENRFIVRSVIELGITLGSKSWLRGWRTRPLLTYL